MADDNNQTNNLNQIGKDLIKKSILKKLGFSALGGIGSTVLLWILVFCFALILLIGILTAMFASISGGGGNITPGNVGAYNGTLLPKPASYDDILYSGNKMPSYSAGGFCVFGLKIRKTDGIQNCPQCVDYANDRWYDLGIATTRILGNGSTWGQSNWVLIGQGSGKPFNKKLVNVFPASEENARLGDAIALSKLNGGFINHVVIIESIVRQSITDITPDFKPHSIKSMCVSQGNWTVGFNYSCGNPSQWLENGNFLIRSAQIDASSGGGDLPQEKGYRANAIISQNYAKKKVSKKQYKCLYKLFEKESNWQWNSTNLSSSAYGIPQALPPDKMKSAGDDWKDNAFTQIDWGLSYIKNRYKTSCKALKHSQNNGWY